MDTKQFEQQSSQIEKYMQNDQLLQLKGVLQEQLSYLTSLQFDQDLQQKKLKMILDWIYNITVMDDFLNHKYQRTSE